MTMGARAALVFVGMTLWCVCPFPVSSMGVVVSEAADLGGLRLLEEVQSVITELAERVKPAVVSVFPVHGPSRPTDAPRERAPNAPGSGSGVIIDPQGHIVTNNHVVGEANEVEVRLSDKTKFIAFVNGTETNENDTKCDNSTDRQIICRYMLHVGTLKSIQLESAVENLFSLDRNLQS